MGSIERKKGVWDDFRWLKADIVCLICHLQHLCSYSRERQSQRGGGGHGLCVCGCVMPPLPQLRGIINPELLFSSLRAAICLDGRPLHGSHLMDPDSGLYQDGHGGLGDVY